MFLNGVRPVLLMAGIDISNKDEIKDTTDDWGSTRPPADRASIPTNNPVDYNTNNWIKWLSDAGIPNWNAPRDGTKSIDNQQIFLTEGAKFLYKTYGTAKINILAHSMGGVVSRQFTFEKMQLSLYLAPPSGYDYNHYLSIDKLITFDSPHTGVQLVGIPLFALGDAQFDLGLNKMVQFNSFNSLANSWKYNNGNNVDASHKHVYFLQVHGKTNQCNLVSSGCSLNYYTADGKLFDSDFITDDSARGIAYPDSFYNLAKNMPGTYATYSDPVPDLCDHKINFDDRKCHEWTIHTPDLKDWVANNAGIFDFNKNNVIGPNATPLPTTVAVTAQPIQPGLPKASGNVSINAVQTLLQTTGTIAPGSTITVPFTVDNATNVTITVGAAASPVQARLENSGGTALITDQATPVSFSAPGTFLAPGSYKVILTAGALTASTIYAVEVEGTSDLSLGVRIIPPTAGATVPGKVEAILVNGLASTPVGGATVSAVLTAINNNITAFTANLTLRDDGTGGDATAGDGKYTALLPNGLTIETILVNVTATGTFAGNAFTRQNSDAGRARSGELLFNGSYSWQTLSKGAGSTSDIDSILLSVGLQVQQTGTYQLNAVLVAADGTSAGATSVTRALNSGNNTIQLNFDGLELWQRQLAGPYIISALSAKLVNGSNLRESDEVNDTSVLPQLNVSLNQLHHAVILQNGPFSDSGIEPNSSGKFQKLQISLPLNIAKTDTYTYSAVLRTSSGLIAGEIQGQANLTVGTATPLIIKFTGSNIYSIQQNGPYLLENLVISNLSGQVLLFVYQLGPTNNYRYSQFAPGSSIVVTVASDDGTGTIPGTLSDALKQATRPFKNGGWHPSRAKLRHPLPLLPKPQFHLTLLSFQDTSVGRSPLIHYLILLSLFALVNGHRAFSSAFAVS